MGGDGTSWLKAPDGWILECTISTNSALPTLYSVVAGPVGLRNEEDSQEEPDSEDKARTDIAQQSTVLLSIGESSTVDAAATADTSRFYSREHQRSSRLFEQFETTSKRTPADAGAKIDGSAAKSSSGDFGKTSSSSSTRPPFSAIIYGSDNEEADEGAHPSCPAPSSAAASATALRRDHHRGRTSDASAEQQQQQIEDCLQTLQGLLERHRGGGKRYGDLYQAVASSASTANRSSQTGKVEEVPRKLQRLVDMQSQMEQVAENLVALSNNVIHCQQTLQGMIAGNSMFCIKY